MPMSAKPMTSPATIIGSPGPKRVSATEICGVRTTASGASSNSGRRNDSDLPASHLASSNTATRKAAVRRIPQAAALASEGGPNRCHCA